jgi:hypothetical protein
MPINDGFLYKLALLAGYGNTDRSRIHNIIQYAMTAGTIAAQEGLLEAFRFVYIDLIISPHPILIFSLLALCFSQGVLLPIIQNNQDVNFLDSTE